MMQEVEQTHDETVAMYMKNCTKQQLAEMLANANEALKAQPVIVTWGGNTITVISQPCTETG